jgi:hypothetical protein
MPVRIRSYLLKRRLIAGLSFGALDCPGRPHVRFRLGATGKGSKARALPWTRQGHSPWNQSVGVCSIDLNSLHRTTPWPP